MARKKNLDVAISAPKRTKPVKTGQMKKLKELQKVNTELEKRSKVSGKLFDRKHKLMGQLGLDKPGF